jgi:hypothetical protein
VANVTAPIPKTTHDSHTARKEPLDVKPIIDSSFPSVLVYGTLGSIISIATVWLVSVLVYAPISAPVVGA